MDELNNRPEEGSVVEALYELWLDRDPAWDENARQLYEKLGEWVEPMTVEEADRLVGLIAELCTAYSRKGFLDGAKMSGLLLREILLENKHCDRECGDTCSGCPTMRNMCNRYKNK